MTWPGGIAAITSGAPKSDFADALRPGSASSDSGVVTIRKYGDEFTTELRATGRDGAEYVGILHYSESVYNCRENNIENCSEPSTVPVTEIFRYADGRWIY